MSEPASQTEPDRQPEAPEKPGLPETVAHEPMLPGESATLPPAESTPQLAPRPWPTIAGYEVLGELGRGGMGVVYKAKQLGLNREVALKMVLSAEHASPEQLARFRAEAEAVARLQHPNIVQIHEIGESKGCPYFSLEYVDGGCLRDMKGKLWRFEAAARMVATLAEAMHYAHERGVIHRDLKPANVLLTADGTPKITDFGLAKRLEGDSGQTKTGQILGTPSYMAPEQADGKKRDIGPATDVYALGAILYELLTGRPPFQAETALDTLLKVVTEQVPAPRSLRASVQKDLEMIVLTCLRKSPTERYASAANLGEDLNRFLRGEPLQTPRTNRLRKLVVWARRRARLVTLVVLAALVIPLPFAANWGWHSYQEKKSERRFLELLENGPDRWPLSTEDMEILKKGYERIVRKMLGAQAVHDEEERARLQEQLDKLEHLARRHEMFKPGAEVRAGAKQDKVAEKPERQRVGDDALAQVRRSGQAIVNQAYPLAPAVGGVTYNSASLEGVVRQGDGYEATVKLHYSNALAIPYSFEIVVAYDAKGVFRSWKVVRFNDPFPPNIRGKEFDRWPE